MQKKKKETKEPGKDTKKEPGTGGKDKPDVPKKPRKKTKGLNIENRYATIEVNSIYTRFPRATGGTTQVIRFSGSKAQVDKIPPFDSESSEKDKVISVGGADYAIPVANNPCIESQYCQQYTQVLAQDEGSFMPLINTICDLLDMRISQFSSSGIEACEAYSDNIKTNLCSPLMPNVTVWFGSFVRSREYLLTKRSPKKKTAFDDQG